MVVAATGCVLIGLFPSLLYHRLPHQTEYHAYTVAHIVGQLQLLAFTALAFLACERFGWLRPVQSLHDVDWLYRDLAPAVLRPLVKTVKAWWPEPWLKRIGLQFWHALGQQSGESGLLSRTLSTGVMAFFAILLLGVYLVIYYR